MTFSTEFKHTFANAGNASLGRKFIHSLDQNRRKNFGAETSMAAVALARAMPNYKQCGSVAIRINGDHFWRSLMILGDIDSMDTELRGRLRRSSLGRDGHRE
jgi:hypothetical protein